MQIFISSTFKDLEDYRKAAAEGILAAGHRPFLVENMPAQTIPVNEVINSAIEASDVYLTILGDNYGSLIRGKNISWTEYETEKAVQLGKPGFVYLIQESKKTPTIDRLADIFRGRVAESHLVKFVSDPLELRYFVERDLNVLSIVDDAEDITSSETASIILPPVELTHFKTLLENPDELQKCSARYFEELIAELLSNDGWDVEIVARVNAPGPDIVAVSSRFVKGVPLKLIVECKKYSETNPVDINVVRKVMYWVNEEYRATMGMIATTGRFTKDAIGHANQYHEWRLDLKDQLAILHWLKRSMGKRIA